MRDLIETVRIVNKKHYLRHKPCLLLCVGCEINNQPSLIIHDVILTDQLGNVLEIFIYLPAFQDTGLPRGNVHERDSGPIPCEVLSLPTLTTRKGWSHHRGPPTLLFFE